MPSKKSERRGRRTSQERSAQERSAQERGAARPKNFVATDAEGASVAHLSDSTHVSGAEHPPKAVSPKALLERFNLRPKHSFGQNFLADAHLAARIASLATPEPDCEVIELGAGLGALTSHLLDRAARVIAVERDRDLVPALQELFEAALATGRLEVLEADAKQVDFRGCFRGPLGGRVLAGNLPYQITGPLLERTVALGRELRRAVFLVQREVADRLAAQPNTGDYGGLTVFVQAQFEVERAFIVRRGAFYPQPRVDSAVVVLEPRSTPLSEETPVFRSVVKAAFAARRKTLRNAWSGLAPTDILLQAARSAAVDLDVRGETLSVAQFAAFAQELELLRQRSPAEPT